MKLSPEVYIKAMLAFRTIEEQPMSRTNMT